LNREEIIRKKVHEKVGDYSPTGLLESAVNVIALNKMDEEAFAAEIGSKLCDDIPGKLSPMGITGTAHIRYNRGGYLVVRVDVEDVNLSDLLRFKERESAAGHIDRARMITPSGVRNKLRAKLMDGIAGKLTEELPASVIARMDEVAGLQIRCIAKREAEQAPFFYQYLEELGQGPQTSPDQRPGVQKRSCGGC